MLDLGSLESDGHPFVRVRPLERQVVDDGQRLLRHLQIWVPMDRDWDGKGAPADHGELELGTLFGAHHSLGVPERLMQFELDL